MKKKCLPAYEMLNLRHGHWGMLWPIFFMVRRVLFVVGVCALIEYPVYQVFLFLLPTLAVMAVLALVRPLEDRTTNLLEIYNSFTILCMSYCLLCFTEFVLDPGARYQMGFVMVILTVKNICVNLYVVGSGPARMCKLRCKSRWLRRKQIQRKWSLRAQRTKNFLRRTFTRRSTLERGTAYHIES